VIISRASRNGQRKGSCSSWPALSVAPYTPSAINEDNPKKHIDELTAMARRDSIMFARCLWGVSPNGINRLASWRILMKTFDTIING
jgi:hypothetical protein